MKISTSSFLLFSALFMGAAEAKFDGTDREFFEIIEAGGIPQGLDWIDEAVGEEDRYLRELQREPKKSGERCGRFRQCEEGLECVRTGVGRVCVPDLNCINNVIEQFRIDNGLTDYGEQIMEKSGWKGKDIANKTAVDEMGLFESIAKAPQLVVRKDAREMVSMITIAFG